MYLVYGDITNYDVDVIVNAANTTLLGGGGVDGAIHQAAGKRLLNYCKGLGGCMTGQAKISPAFDLPIKAIIHTVGPIWKGGKDKEEDLLKACYENSLKLALEEGYKSIAFPNISTGIYAFPKTKAAKIALSTCSNFKDKIEIHFVCYDKENFKIYQKFWRD